MQNLHFLYQASPHLTALHMQEVPCTAQSSPSLHKSLSACVLFLAVPCRSFPITSSSFFALLKDLVEDAIMFLTTYAHAMERSLGSQIGT